MAEGFTGLSPEKGEHPAVEVAEFGFSGTQELKALEAELARAESAAQLHLEDVGLQRAKRVAALRLELFRVEHDNAGAFKFHRKFGREINELFAGTTEKPPVVETRESQTRPYFVLPERERNRRLLFVSMGELDRFNKEGGGHKKGDEILTETVQTIDRVVHGRVGAQEGERTGYQLYRVTGNEFCVSFDSITEELLEEIQDALRVSKPAIGGLAPAPLDVAPVSLAEVVDIMNQAQADYPPGERVGLTESAGREAMGVLRHLSEFALEEEKFIGRVERLREKLATEPREEVETFFENYLKKAFAANGFPDLASFEQFLASSEKSFETAVGARAFEVAQKRMRDESRRDSVIQYISEVRGKRVQKTPRAPVAFRKGIGATGEYAAIPEFTKGLTILEEALERSVAAEGTPAEEEQKLAYQIELSRRDAGTGFLDRGSFYAVVNELCKGEKPGAVVFIDMGFLKYFDQVGGREVGNGAVKLAASIIERAIDASGVRARAYRYGGDEFTVLVDGSRADGELFREALSALASRSEPVPPKGNVSESYVGEKLVFNTGIADRDDAWAIIDELQQMEVGEEHINETDILVGAADYGIEAQKAIDRFHFLVERLRLAPEGSKERAHVESLVAFSKKAIFAELHGVDALMHFAESTSLTPQELESQIRAFVADKSELRAGLNQNKKESTDRLIELHVAIDRLTERVHALKKGDTTARDERSRLKKNIIELRSRQEQISGVRQRIAGERTAA